MKTCISPHYNESPLYFAHATPESSVSTLKEISRIPGNPDRFWVISGKWNNSKKFQKEYGKDIYVNM